MKLNMLVEMSRLILKIIIFLNLHCLTNIESNISVLPKYLMNIISMESVI